MGIRGLKYYTVSNHLLKDFRFALKESSSFVNEKYPTDPIDLQVSASKNKVERIDSKYSISTSPSKPYNLVIDGRSILHYIYKENCSGALGGQYSEFREKILEFFNSLQKFDLEIIGVVLDVANSDPEVRALERDSLLSRTMSIASLLKLFREGPFQLNTKVEQLPLPRLCYVVLVNTLNELKIPIYLTGALGDQSVASLADLMGASVLSDDSDYMIYDLKHGYLPLSELNLVTGECKIFYAETFAKHLDLPVSFLKLYAAAMGNNLFELEDLKYLYPRVRYQYFKALHFHVWPLLVKLKTLSVTDALDRFLSLTCQYPMRGGPTLKEWKDRFTYILDFYSFSASLTEIKTDSEFGPYAFGRLVPKYQFFKCEAVVEDLSKPSAWLASRPLRKLFYSHFPELGCVLEMIRTQTGDIQEQPVKIPQIAQSESITEKLVTPFRGDGLIFSLSFLMEYKHLRFTPFLAIALANVVPLPVLKDDIHSITIHTEMVHAIALLETTMISWAMVTNEHLTHLMDAFHAHFFYEKLMRFTPQSVSCVIEQLAEDYSDEVLDFFKSVFGEELDMSSIDFEDDGGFWVFDLN